MTFFKTSHLRLLVGIFLLAFCVRGGYFALEYRAHNFDIEQAIHGDDGYYELSRGILAGHGLSWDSEPPYRPNPLRTPVYPYAIAGVLWATGSYWVVLALQVLIGSLTPVLSFFLARRLTVSIKIAAAVGVAMALQPYHVLFSTIFYTETLFIFLFLSFVLLFLRYLDESSLQRLALASGVLGLAILTKPTIQYLPVVVAAFVLWRYRRAWRTALVQAAVSCGIVLLMLAPWFYRNYAAFGVAGMTAQPAFNLIVYLAPSVIALEQGSAIDQEAFLKERGIDPYNITLATAPAYTAQAVEIIKQHPRGLALVVVLSGLTFFTHDGMLTVLQYAGYTPSSYLSAPAVQLALTAPLQLLQELSARAASPLGLVLLMRVLGYAITLMFVVGAALYLWRGPRSAAGVFGLVLVAYFMCTTPINGLGVNARFRMPVEPIILSVAALGAVAIFRRLPHTASAISHEQTVGRNPVL